MVANGLSCSLVVLLTASHLFKKVAVLFGIFVEIATGHLIIHDNLKIENQMILIKTTQLFLNSLLFTTWSYGRNLHVFLFNYIV